MKPIYLFLITILVLTACQPKNEYIISGQIEGIPDGEWLFLYDTDSRDYFDSTEVVEESFQFTGQVEDTVLYLLVFKANPQQVQYTSVWVENIPIKISGSVTDFNDLVIDGSDINKQSDELLAQLKPLNDRMDSIYSAYNPEDMDKAAVLQQMAENIEAQMQEVQLEFIKEHGDYYYSTYLFSRLIRQLSSEEGLEIYNNLSEELKTTGYAKSAKEYLELNKNLQVGDKYVDLTLPDPDGNERSISEFDGKYVLIDFWASWCNPCRRENPVIKEAYEQFKEKGFEIYAVSLDEDSLKWKEAINQDRISWTTVIDTKAFNSKAAMIYAVQYIPHNFLINPDGEISAIDIRGEDLIIMLEELL